MSPVRRGMQFLLLSVAIPATLLASDTLLVHGHIYTSNPKAPWAEVGGVFYGAAQGGAAPTLLSYVPEERLTVEQAVNAYTRGSAYANFTDDRLGTLESGKLADLVVLSQDIFSAPHEQIGKTQVMLTMVGGKIVFSGMK